MKIAKCKLQISKKWGPEHLKKIFPLSREGFQRTSAETSHFEIFNLQFAFCNPI
jgi:hypothetical protein